MTRVLCENGEVGWLGFSVAVVLVLGALAFVWWDEFKLRRMERAMDQSLERTARLIAEARESGEWTPNHPRESER